MLGSPPIWCSKQIKMLHDSFCFDPDLCGSPSSTNNLRISSDRKLNYPTLEKDHGEVTGGFLRWGAGGRVRGYREGMLPYLGCAEGEEEL